jgi:regulator of cell morphogenesis and NO signaling
MEMTENSLISALVASDYRTAAVFTAHGIDFCCGGGVSLGKACGRDNIDLNQMLDELRTALDSAPQRQYQSMSNGTLIDVVISEHHAYVRRTVPIIRSYLSKLCTVHGTRHPELYSISTLFSESATALIEHMDLEESELFPNIRYEEVPVNLDHFKKEHEIEGARFKEISALTHGYICPADGCQTYRVAFAMLADFERDLHKHVHLENNILFPRTLSTQPAMA